VSNHKDYEAIPRPLSAPLDRALQSWYALAGKAWVRRLSLIIFACLLLAIPKLISSNYWMRIIDLAGLYAIMAIGYNVMLGYTGLFNLGFAAFFAIGAYCYALLASPLHDVHLPFLVIFPLAVLLTALISYLLGIPSLPLKGDYLGLVTLAFAESLGILVNNLDFTNAAYGIIDIDPIRVPFFTLKTVRDYYYLILFVCAVTFFIIKRLEESRIGRAWLAIREDEEAARTMGIDTRRLKLLACAIGAAPVGLAGAIFAGMQTFISPVSFSSRETWLILTMVIIGGIGNVSGAVLGALLLTILPEPLRGTPIESARILIYGLLLVFFAHFRPEGLWPRRWRKR